MRASTHHEALRTAARLALPFGLAGCGATVTVAVPARDASTDTPAPDVSAAPDVSLRCAEADPARPAAAEAACCEAMVDEAVRADAGVATPRLTACCAALAQWFDLPQNAGATWPGTAARGMCCTALEGRGSNTCTPWGPPVPPTRAADEAPVPDGAVLDLRATASVAAPALPDLPHLYAAAQGTWLGRMVNEHESAAVFEALAAQLRGAGFGEDTARACEEFAREERRHGVLCGAVVQALGGEARAPSRAHPAFPAHADVDPREAALRNVLSVCCLSETVAVALIGAERLEMPDGPLRDLLTQIFADEVGHARFGWALLRDLAPTLSADVCARLGAYLSLAFAHLERHELAHLPVAGAPPPEAAALGLCDGRGARALFFDTVSAVIVPALEALAIPAAQSWSQRTAA
jgi:hypothetical protein